MHLQLTSVHHRSIYQPRVRWLRKITGSRSQEAVRIPVPIGVPVAEAFGGAPTQAVAIAAALASAMMVSTASVVMVAVRSQLQSGLTAEAIAEEKADACIAMPVKD